MRVDVAVVGGGPVGSFVGGLLAKQGFDVVVIEEHGEVGNPACCAGIVGAKGLEELEIRPGEWVAGRLRRAMLYPPSGEPIELGRGRVEAFVVDRAEFDRSIAREAVRAGVTFFFKSRCTDLRLDGDPVLKLAGLHSGELRARLVIGADGPSSLVARKTGIPEPARFLKCAQAEVIGEAKEDMAEIYLGHSVAPGFFGWLIKAGDVCRVGLGTAEKSPRYLLYRMLEKHPVVSKKVERKKVLSMCVDLIPEPGSRRMHADRVLLVGDAAGHIKPLTGGGLYVGLSCAKIASEVAARALEETPDEKTLQVYDQMVRKEFGLEFDVGIRIRKVFEQMSDEDIISVLDILRKEKMRKFIFDHFDFDHHSGLIRALAVELPEVLGDLGIRKTLKYIGTLFHKP